MSRFEKYLKFAIATPPPENYLCTGTPENIPLYPPEMNTQ